MAEWEIKKTLGECYGSGGVFEVGQEYFAALSEGQEGLERRDYGVEYWDQNKPETYCFWKTRMADSAQKKKLFIDDEMLMAFFERLTEETAEEKVNFRFVLTLILMRKRKLKYDSSRIKDDKEVWSLRVTGQDRHVEVINPNLTEEQIEQLSEQMGEIMQVDL
jgi:hypothetical protein